MIQSFIWKSSGIASLLIIGLFLPGTALTAVEFAVLEDVQVLTRGESGSWDSDVMRFPYVVFHNGKYHLFYEARATIEESFLAIGYAVSEDGIHWEKHNDNPIFEGDGTGFDAQSVARPVIRVDEDGSWIMYYNGSDGEDTEAIGVATAPSPIGPWHRSDAALVKSGPTGAWDHGLILPDQVIETESGFLMYYSGRIADGGNAMIGLATSQDGLIWQKHNDPSNDANSPLFAESDPILVSGPGWDQRAAWTPNVFRHDDGWMMIYNAFGNLGLALSEDGINWKKDNDNPFHRDSSLFHPTVIIDANSEYWIYYRNLKNESLHRMRVTITIP